MALESIREQSHPGHDKPGFGARGSKRGGWKTVIGEDLQASKHRDHESPRRTKKIKTVIREERREYMYLYAIVR